MMPLVIKSTTSPDGTKITYYEVGTGPGLVIVHGAMQSGQSHTELAHHLSPHFTCYLPDRRGRGQSGPLGQGHLPSKEVADIQNLLHETGAPFLFGVSSGAFLALNAARPDSSTSTGPASSPSSTSISSQLKRIAVFEPPWWPEAERASTTAWVKRYEEEMSRGALAEALATAMLGSKMGPPFLHSRYMPRWAVVSASRVMIHGEDGIRPPLRSGPLRPHAIHDEVDNLPKPPSFRQLAQCLHSDISIGQDMFGEERLRTLAQVKTETLILSGDSSPSYLRQSALELCKVLPNARGVELANAHHTVTGNADQLGDPKLVANELRKFFLQDEG